VVNLPSGRLQRKGFALFIAILANHTKSGMSTMFKKFFHWSLHSKEARVPGIVSLGSHALFLVAHFLGDHKPGLWGYSMLIVCLFATAELAVRYSKQLLSEGVEDPDLPKHIIRSAHTIVAVHVIAIGGVTLYFNGETPVLAVLFLLIGMALCFIANAIMGPKK
jgi:hypothetical protein